MFIQFDDILAAGPLLVHKLTSKTACRISKNVAQNLENIGAKITGPGSRRKRVFYSRLETCSLSWKTVVNAVLAAQETTVVGCSVFSL